MTDDVDTDSASGDTVLQIATKHAFRCRNAVDVSTGASRLHMGEAGFSLSSEPLAKHVPTLT